LPVQLRLTQDTPAKPVDHAHHRVEVVPETVLFRHHVAAESHRRNVQAKLHDEGNDIPEVAVLDIQRGEVESDPEGGEKREDDEQGQENDLPGRHILVKRHEHQHQSEGNGKIHKGGDDRTGRNDQAREIDFGDQVGVADQAVAGFGQGVGEELPGQHGGIY